MKKRVTLSLSEELLAALPAGNRSHAVEFALRSYLQEQRRGEYSERLGRELLDNDEFLEEVAKRCVVIVREEGY